MTTFNNNIACYKDRLKTEVRHQKDRSIIAKAAGDTTMQTKAQLRINQLTDKYAELSDASGLPTKMERMNVRGFKTLNLPKKSLTEIENDDIIKEIKELGVKGEIQLIPTQIDLAEFSFDDKHIKKERTHNVTLKDAEYYVRNAKVSITTWKGKFEKYISENGATYVDKENKIIRTAFSSDEFDEKRQKMLEVLRRHGR